MGAVAADTHALLWYLFDPGRLSQPASAALDQAVSGGDRIVISAISLVETVYLVEKGRLPDVVLPRLTGALSAPDAELAVAPLTREVAEALPKIPRNIVPDMPDRIIAATALLLDVPLVTRDQKIRAARLTTIW